MINNERKADTEQPITAMLNQLGMNIEAMRVEFNSLVSVLSPILKKDNTARADRGAKGESNSSKLFIFLEEQVEKLNDLNADIRHIKDLIEL